MSNTVGGTIVWNLEADSSQAEKAFSDLSNKAQESGDAIDKAIRDSMDKAGESAKKGAKSIGDSISSLGGSLKDFGKDMSIGITAPIVAIGGTAIAFTEVAGKYSSVKDAFKSMTSEMGINADEFQKKVAKAVGGQIDNLQILKGATTSLALIGKDSFKDFGNDFAKMAELAKKSSRAMGTDVDYAFNSLVLGVSRMSKPWLDNLGISIDIDTAYKKYAESIGVAAKSLTDQQQKTAVLNEAMFLLEDRFGKVAVSAGGFSGVFQQVKTTITNSTIAIGQELEPELAKLAKSFVKLMDEILPKIIVILREAINWWASLSTGTQQNIIMAVAFVAAMGPVLAVIGTLISTIGSIVSVIVGAINVISKFSLVWSALGTIFTIIKGGAILVATFIGGISAPVWVVIGVITALIGIGYLLYKNWDWVSEKAREFVRILVDNFWFLVGQANNVKNSVVDAFWNMVNSIRSLAGRIYDAVTSPFRDAWREIQNIAQRIKDALNAINPWHRNSPSLVDNIKSGIKEIEKQFGSLSNIEIPKLSASYNVQSFADGGPDQPSQQVSRNSTINQYNQIYEQVDLDQAMSDLNFALRMG